MERSMRERKEGREEMGQLLHILKHIMFRFLKHEHFPSKSLPLSNLAFLAKNKDPAVIITYCS